MSRYEKRDGTVYRVWNDGIKKELSAGEQALFFDLEAAERRAEELEQRLRLFAEDVRQFGLLAQDEPLGPDFNVLIDHARSALAPPSEPVVQPDEKEVHHDKVEPAERECPDCGGAGGRSVMLIRGRVRRRQLVDCPTCKGTGRVPEPEQQAEERA